MTDLRIMVFCYSMCIAFHAMTQGAGDLLQSYTESHHTEKIYVHTDKQYYLPEEVIYGKVYHVHGQDHRLIDTSVLIHVELWDSSRVMINDLLVKTSNGQASFTIETSLGYEPGLYTLKAYTQYQKNFAKEYLFHKHLAIITKPDQVNLPTYLPMDSLSIDFYPEGGYLIDNLPSVVAYRIKGANAMDGLSGLIMSHTGDTIQTLKPMIDGYGTFNFTPAPGIDYFAELVIAGQVHRFELPISLSSGVVINVSHLDSFIALQSTLSSDLINKELSIVGHIRGEVFLDATFSKRTLFKLLPKELPSGVLHFTVFDHHLNPIAERLVFNENPSEKIDLSITIDQSKQTVRSQIRGSISSSIEDQINGSLTIYSDELFASKLRGIDIHNYLLLQSDLRGPIINLHQFLKKDKHGQSNIDLLMRTHGWRRFDWQEVLSANYPELIYPAETTTLIAGQVILLRNGKPIKSDVLITVLNKDQFLYEKLVTDDQGLFYFSGLELKDSTDIILQASKFRKNRKSQDPNKLEVQGNRLVKINLIDLNESSLSNVSPIPAMSISPHLMIDDFGSVNYDKEKSDLVSINQADIFGGALWSIDLENVTISSSFNRAQKRNIEAKRKYREKNIAFLSSTDKFNPSDSQFEQYYFNNVFHMMSQVVPSLHLRFRNGAPTVVFGTRPDAGEPLFALEGNLVRKEVIAKLDPHNIALIDIWTGLPAQGIYGSGAVVVLLLKDKDQILETPKKGLSLVSLPGYHQARTYSSPDLSLESLDKPDLRTTLLWDADVVIGQDSYSFIFNTSDLIGDFSIEFEGISSMGVPVTKQLSITVE